MVIALVGRRIDAPGATASIFPEGNVAWVRERIQRLLRERDVRALVCSAACGADLLALQAAGTLGIRRRIILPFEQAHFRTTSVTDRPGDWGPIFDQAITEVRAERDLVDLQLEWDNDDSYLRANCRILDEVLSLAAATHDSAAAVLVWNAIAREGNDITNAFGEDARARGLAVFDVSTL